MQHLPRYLVFVFLLAQGPLPLAAAEFRVDPNANSCIIRLDGDIERGDLEKLKAKLEPFGLGPTRAGPDLCLNSKGGDFVEGLRLAEFVSDGISTSIGAGASCESACAWIFMAGSHRDTGGSEWSRTMDARATLSFHAPFIDPSSLAVIGGQPGPATAKKIIQAYNQAVSELGRGLLGLARISASKNAAPLVPATLVAEALLKIGDDKLVVDTTGLALRWSVGVEGYRGAVPHSKEDVIRACVIGSAIGNEFWNDDYLSITQAEEYEAYYDDRSRTLVAALVVQGLAHIACEMEFVFNDDLSSLENGGFGVTVNVGSEESVTKSWIRDRYESKRLSLPDFAVLNYKTKLKQLAGSPSSQQRPAALATMSRPQWCSSQQLKAPDEKTVCDTPRLTTYEIFLGRYYSKAIAEADTPGKSKLQSQQREWLSRRRLCGDEIKCLAEAYHSRIAALKGAP